MRRSAAGSAAPPRALIVSRRRLTVVGADPDSREGPATAWLLIRLRGGSCQIHGITAGTARRTASHRAVAAAKITAAVAGTTATGARAASWVIRGGGCPPVNRASIGGNAKAVKIRATSPVTPCLTSILRCLNRFDRAWTLTSLRCSFQHPPASL